MEQKRRRMSASQATEIIALVGGLMVHPDGLSSDAEVVK